MIEYEPEQFALKIRVTAAPEKGKANKAVIKLLAKELGISPSGISLCANETGQNKVFRINNSSDSLITKLKTFA